MARGRSRKLDKPMKIEATAAPSTDEFRSPAHALVMSVANRLTDFAAPVAVVESPADEELFSDLDDVPRAETTLFDEAPSSTPAPPPSPEMIADADLEDEARRELARLLNAAISLHERATLLVKLAHHTDTKRAPVALRAIAEINVLTGLTRERPVDTMPMFQLPPDAVVSVVVERVVS